MASEILLATFLDVDNLNFELKSYRVDNNLLVQSVSSQQCSSGIAHPRSKRWQRWNYIGLRSNRCRIHTEGRWYEVLLLQAAVCRHSTVRRRRSSCSWRTERRQRRQGWQLCVKTSSTMILSTRYEDSSLIAHTYLKFDALVFALLDGFRWRVVEKSRGDPLNFNIFSLKKSSLVGWSLEIGFITTVIDYYKPLLYNVIYSRRNKSDYYGKFERETGFLQPRSRVLCTTDYSRASIHREANWLELCLEPSLLEVKTWHFITDATSTTDK